MFFQNNFVVLFCLIYPQVNQAPPRTFLNLVHDGMGRAEKIIKAVMLPVGSNLEQHHTSELQSIPNSTSGFVNEQSAMAFLTSYDKLMLKSNELDLQKILDMKVRFRGIN